MKKIYLLLFTLSVAAVSSHAAQQTLRHTIKNGETLSVIARKNHTTIQEMQKANGIKKGEMLKLGRVLIVPRNEKIVKSIVKAPGSNLSILKTEKKTVAKTSIKEPAAPVATYRINKGDTLSVIARKNHTTIREIQKANGIKKGETLKLGRVLTVPQDKKLAKTITKAPKSNLSILKMEKKTVAKTSIKEPAAPVATYRINKGDTLSVIARKNHTTIREIQKANGIKKGETLKLGRVLTVPQNKKLAKSFIANNKKVKNKTLVASLAKLETIKIEKKIESTKNQKVSASDISFCEKNKDSVKCTKITKLAQKKLGGKYVWGATGNKNTFDCSGLTTYVYKENGIKLPRRAIAQSKIGKHISRNELKKGDLLFFDTSRRSKGYVNHVGIYIGDGKFIHASSAKKKVVTTRLDVPFYSQRFKEARRVNSL